MNPSGYKHYLDETYLIVVLIYLAGSLLVFAAMVWYEGKYFPDQCKRENITNVLKSQDELLTSLLSSMTLFIIVIFTQNTDLTIRAFTAISFGVLSGWYLLIKTLYYFI